MKCLLWLRGPAFGDHPPSRPPRWHAAATQPCTSPRLPPSPPFHHLPAAIPAHLRSKGWSDARAFASTQLQKNPNSFFYRHVAPHEQQVRSLPPPRSSPARGAAWGGPKGRAAYTCVTPPHRSVFLTGALGSAPGPAAAQCLSVAGVTHCGRFEEQKELCAWVVRAFCSHMRTSARHARHACWGGACAGAG